MTIRHDCTKQGCYKETCLPDWGIFDGCFNEKSERIRIGDLDGVVEVDGSILFLEWKRFENRLSYGQERLFRSLTENSAKQKVLIVYGDLNCRDGLKYQIISGGKFGGFIPCDVEILREMLGIWTLEAMGRLLNV